ncbi:DUF417 family protein [Sphingobacterium sp. Mn56C]|uniref:DUF417 family protein n=1 Tax=Sphingobacterium sp. Mn56C TaxID=3395261 RepID=UPI003BE13E2C
MQFNKKKQPQLVVNSYGYYLILASSALILFWIGLFKFTPTEAHAIRPLVAHHPLSYWMYAVFSEQWVSNIVGGVEITVASLLLLSLKFVKLKRFAGIGMVVIFLMTLSYLFTTANMWKLVDGFPTTDFFILKDLLFLGFGIGLLQFKNA